MKEYNGPCCHWMTCEVCGQAHRDLNWILYNAKERLKGDPYREEPIRTTLLMILGPCMFTAIEMKLKIENLGLDNEG